MSFLVSASSPVNPEATEFRLPISAKIMTSSAMPAPPPTPPPLSLTTVKLTQVSLTMALNAGYGSLFQNDLEAQMNFYLIEFLATIPPLPVQTQPGVQIVLGAGVRIALAASRAENQMSLNLAVIAAQATTGVVRHEMKTEIAGVPNSMSAKFFADFGNPMKFDLEALRNFGTAVSTLATEMVKEAGKPNPAFNLKPWQIKENSRLDSITKSQAASVGFALSRILEGNSLSQARRYLTTQNNSSRFSFDVVDESIVESVYMSVVGDSGAPSESAKALAASIYSLGD